MQSICDDPKVLAQNYALKLNNDDYKQMDHQKALVDFMDRVKAYEQVYEVGLGSDIACHYEPTEHNWKNDRHFTDEYLWEQ